MTEIATEVTTLATGSICVSTNGTALVSVFGNNLPAAVGQIVELHEMVIDLRIALQLAHDTITSNSQFDAKQALQKAIESVLPLGD